MGADKNNIDGFYRLTPATRILHGMTPNDKTIYSDALEGVDRGRYGLYSNHARDLVDNAVFIEAFSGKSLDDKGFMQLWETAVSKIGQDSGNHLIQTQQKRDALWHVLESELGKQQRFLNYLKGNKFSNTFDVDLATNRVEKFRMIISRVEKESLHNSEFMSDIFFEKDQSWADVAIQKGRGTYRNDSNREQTVYLLNTSLAKVDPDMKSLENISYDMIGSGMTLRPGDFMQIMRGKRFLVLKNPIRSVSVKKDEFMHGLAAFAAGTTLTPESFRSPIEEGRRGLFYGDVDLLKQAIRDEAKGLKSNLQKDKNNKSMHYAVNNWVVTDLMRIFAERWIDSVPAGKERTERMKDVYEMLTLVEPLHGASASIEGLPKIALPLFIQNRDIFRVVSDFYLKQYGDEGKEIISDYLKRKSKFYRVFKREAGDMDDIEGGMKTRLYDFKGGILPKDFENISRHHAIINDLINSPLRKFWDHSLRQALYDVGGITTEMLDGAPNKSRTLSRPWGSSNDYYVLENYTSSMNSDPSGMSTPRGKTKGEQSLNALLDPLCP